MLDIADSRFTDSHWQRYFDLMVQLRRRYHANLTAESWPSFKQRLLSLQSKEPARRRWVLFENDTAIAWLEFRLEHAGTSQPETWIFADVNFDDIPGQLCRRLARQLHSAMQEFRVTEGVMPALDRRLSVLCERWQGRRLNGLNEYVLHREEADLDLIRSWATDFPHRYPDLRLQFFPETPLDRAEEFAELLQTCLRDMPEEGESGISIRVDVADLRRQARWRRENDEPSYKYILFNKLDEMIGLTICSINLRNPIDINQDMTGLRRDYRGKGLAKWLKAAMFFKIAEDFPDNRVVITVMRSVNEPMQHINSQMGFVLRRAGGEYRISRSNLRELCDSQ